MDFENEINRRPEDYKSGAIITDGYDYFYILPYDELRVESVTIIPLINRDFTSIGSPLAALDWFNHRTIDVHMLLTHYELLVNEDRRIYPN